MNLSVKKNTMADSTSNKGRIGASVKRSDILIILIA